MNVIRIMGYDVVERETSAIVAHLVPDRAAAETVVAAHAAESFIVPVLNFAGGRVGYKVQT